MLRRFAISVFLVLVCMGAWARTRPHYGGTLRVEIAGDGITSPDATVLHLLLDGLTRIDGNGTLQPDLAVSWKSSSDDHRWQFELRPGVQFHHDFPVTADRVIASLNLSCNGNCPWSAVHAVGSSVVFVSDSPMPNLPWLLTADQFLIRLTDAGDGKEPPCCFGTGPFQMSGGIYPQLLLSANDDYWGGRPFVDTVQILTNRPIRDQWLDLSAGRADIVEVPAQMLRMAEQQRFTVVESPPVELLALTVSDSGALANPVLRAAIAQAVDRSALFNVIFQKQGEITASLLPQALTGYSFLFSTERDLNKANELRGGLTPPPLTLAADGDGTMQLAAQRIALNLREAGFNVQVVNGPHSDLILRKLPLVGGDPATALEILLRGAGVNVSVAGRNSTALFRAEHDFLDLNTLVPLLNLPRACAVGGRVRDLQLRTDGTPDLADVSLEDTQ